MSEKRIQFQINDFKLFADVMKSTQKIVESAKIIINSAGIQIYGAHSKIARCEVTSDAITSSEPTDFCIADLGMFVKVLGTICEVHENDFSDFQFTLEKPFIKFKSKKFKNKIVTCNEDVIAKSVSDKLHTQLTPVFEFTTTSDLIKRINGHAFIFQDPTSLRIYIGTSDDMENNAVFATIGNKETDLNNEMTLKLGLVTFGKSDPNRPIILDLERLNLFNACPSNQLQISLMDKNVLVSKTMVSGKNGSYFSMNIYNSLLKA